MDLTFTQLIVYRLIKKYISRQQMVLAAITNLRPDILAFAKGVINDEVLQMVEKYASVPQTGYWDTTKEWSYFIHAGGCKLIHTVTHEPIEWDAPNVREFDRFWFMNYLVWWLGYSLPIDENSETDLKEWFDSNNKMLQGNVFDAIDDLQSMGLLMQSSTTINPNKFVLSLDT